MSEKPKLLVVADTYHPKVDGTLIFMEEFLKRAGTDFEVSLLVPDFGVRKGRNVTYIEPSKILKVSGYPNLKLSFKNIARIKKAVREAEIVFIQGPAMISYLSIYYAHKYQKITVFYTHTISWELFEKFFPSLLKKLFFSIIKKISVLLYNRCTEILVPYHDLKEHLASEGVKTKIDVARLGVDIDRFTASKDKAQSKKLINLDPRKKVIGYVGRISKEKNTHLLLEAFRKLDSQDTLHLLIVGDGPVSQSKEFRETKNCTVTGFVGDVETYLRAMDIFVMPSLTETTSLATLEAMSSGLPVIVTKIGFMNSYIVKDHNGLFFPRNSSTLLAAKIEKLLKHPEVMERLGQQARKTVAYGFSWERSINRIKKLLLKRYYG